MRIDARAAVTATGGVLLDAPERLLPLRVSTDTRSIEPGDAFLALRGERYDGHAFTEQAVARGAALLILQNERARTAGVPSLMVADTLQAYMALAALSRNAFRGLVIAITGSAGKTTTKSFLHQLLATRYGNRVVSAPANENNEIGVSRLLLSLSSDAHEVAVVEMGARRPNDIADLVRIARPDIGVLTNIGDAHLEIMGSRERLEEAKWALFSGGARAILNGLDEASFRRARALSQPPDWFAAVEDSGLPAMHAALHPYTAITADDRILRRDGEGRYEERRVDVTVPGLHNRANLAAAAAAALRAGVSLDAIAEAIPRLTLPEGRYDRLDVDGLRIIYDAYNANAGGMMAALDAFAAEAASRRIAVLASMAELGSESEALHERVGAHAASRVDILLVAGDSAEALARGARRAGLRPDAIVAVATNAAAARWLREHAKRDDLVLLKGSRRYRLEEIVEALRT